MKTESSINTVRFVIISENKVSTILFNIVGNVVICGDWVLIKNFIEQYSETTSSATIV